MRKRTTPAVCLALAIVLSSPVLAQQRTVILGAEDGWDSILFADRVIVEEGRRGFPDVTLEPFSLDPDQTTELLLGFDSLPIRDETGSHQVFSLPGGSEISSTIQRTGRGALLVDGPEDSLLLQPGEGSRFAAGQEWSSFSISFFLYPAEWYDGDTILRWEAREGADADFRAQELTISVEHQRLLARFENFFVTPDNQGVTVELNGPQMLIPRRWAHHLIRFDGTTGLLEYLADGVPTDITHVSATGRQDGTVYYPRIAEFPGDGIHLAEGFVGALDELTISHRFLPDAPVPVLPPDGGVVVTDFIDLGAPTARLTSIVPVTDEPGLSDVHLYYRLSDLRFRDPLEGPEWLPITDLAEPELQTAPMAGRFVQFRAELFPDTSTGTGPRLSQIALTYEADPPPLPPVRLLAEPGDGEVLLEWAPVLEADVQGYLVYYGEQPGRYYGTASIGASPLDVGPVTSTVLDGLVNGRLYYFAVQAYDRSGTTRHELSREVAARPARIHR